MGKITCGSKSKKRRLNSPQKEIHQQEVIPDNKTQQARWISDNSVNQNQTAGLNILTPSTPSLSLNTSANDGSHVVCPAFCSNNIGQLMINNTNTVHKVSKRKKNHATQAQDGFSDTDASTTTILRTPKKLKKSRKSHSATRRSLIPPSESPPIEGEITGARVTSEYHCSKCRFGIPSLKPSQFEVKCPRCKTSWKCSKVPCTCTAEITLERSNGQMEVITLEDSLLRPLVGFKPQGYCETHKIEKKLLKVGSVRVVCNDGVVKKVMTLFSSSMSVPDMPDVFPIDTD